LHLLVRRVTVNDRRVGRCGHAGCRRGNSKQLILIHVLWLCFSIASGRSDIGRIVTLCRLAIFLQVHFQRLDIIVKAERSHGKQNIFTIDSFTLLHVTSVTRFRCDKGDKLRHALLNTLTRILGNLPSLWNGSLHDLGNVCYRQEAILLAKRSATGGNPRALQRIPRAVIGVVRVLGIVCSKRAFVKIYTLSYYPKDLTCDLILDDLEGNYYVNILSKYKYQSFRKYIELIRFHIFVFRCNTVYYISTCVDVIQSTQKFKIRHVLSWRGSIRL